MNPTFSERLANRTPLINKNGRKILFLNPITFKIKKSYLKTSINKKKRDLRVKIKEYQDLIKVDSTLYDHSKIMLENIEHQYHSLLNVCDLVAEVESYNTYVEKNWIKVQNIKSRYLYPIEIEGFIFGKDKLELI